eukprot:gene1727-2027_t
MGLNEDNLAELLQTELNRDAKDIKFPARLGRGGADTKRRSVRVKTEFRTVQGDNKALEGRVRDEYPLNLPP